MTPALTVPLRLGATEPTRGAGFCFSEEVGEDGIGGTSTGAGAGVDTGVVGRELARERGADGARATGVVGLDFDSAGLAMLSDLDMLSALKLKFGGGALAFGCSTSNSSRRNRKSRPYSWRS
jgi:hypothetical protein